MVYTPSFVGEFPDASIVADCVPATGLMLVNKITHNKYPASENEREALQNAMGTQDAGATNEQLAFGINKRYQIALATFSGITNLLNALSDPTKGVAVIGKYPALPEYLRRQGNQPGFDGTHEMYMQADGTGLLTIGDPLASHFYTGVPASQITAYAQSTAFAYLAGTEQVVRVGWRLIIPAAGTYTFYKVAPFTHTLYGAKRVTFSRPSGSFMRHGIPGFWAFYRNAALQGYYAVYGKSGPFQIKSVWSDGSMRNVNPAF